MTEAELKTIPALSKGMIANILRRQSEQRFKRVTELNDIAGIGRVTYGKIMSRFIVHPDKE